MHTESGNTELKLYEVSGIIANAQNTLEKALLIEKEIGNDSLYAMISMGTPLSRIAQGLGLSTFELEFILKRTAKNRREYLNARAFALAEASAPMLQRLSTSTKLKKSEATAAKHHAGMMANATRILNMGVEDKSGSNITVNNTVVVRNRNEIPELPDGLNEIIEGEFEDVNSKS